MMSWGHHKVNRNHGYYWNLEENKFNSAVIIVAVDALAPFSARPSADIVITHLGLACLQDQHFKGLLSKI